MRTNTPLGVTPVTTAANRWPTRLLERHRGQALIHVALHLAGGVLFQGAIARDGVQVGIGVRRAVFGGLRALSRRCVTRSAKRRLGAVECV